MASILQTGLVGVQRGMQGLQKAAGEIASASRFNPGSSEKPAKDIVQSLVEAKVSSRQVEASVKVIKAGEEAVGSILDVMA